VSPTTSGSRCCVKLSAGRISGLGRVVDYSRKSLSIALARYDERSTGVESLVEPPIRLEPCALRDTEAKTILCLSVR
jgi:hypothetical protein